MWEWTTVESPIHYEMALRWTSQVAPLACLIGWMITSLATGWGCQENNFDIHKTRRTFLRESTTTASHVVVSTNAMGSLLTFNPNTAAAAAASLTTTTSLGLVARLAHRDPSLLRNSVFNLPPAAQIYPSFVRGRWNVTCSFSGYMFPSQRIPRDRLTKDFDIPGFQKCSIAATCDVGKDDVQYVMQIDETTGLEDRSATLTSQANAFLGYPAVKEVIYNVKSNPNRLSIDFYDYRTRNAERIELFCNARESEVWNDDNEDANLFVCSEYIKQVTFGWGPDVGIARQVAGNYAHFWTWKQQPSDRHKLSGNLLTAAYLDPQDPLYFDEPFMPVAIYSHVLSAHRISV